MQPIRVIALSGLAAMLACGGGSSLTAPPGGEGPSSPPAAAVADVSIRDFQFAPATITVKVGATVRWTNKGPSAHTTTSDGGAWDSGTLAPPGSGSGYGSGTSAGGSFEVRFTKPGSYGYHCTIHPPSLYPGFTGTVVVEP